MTEQRTSRLRVAATVLAVFAALVCLASFGIELPSSPFAPLALDGPVVADSTGKHTAIVDTESRRVLILNEEDRLTGIIDCESLNAPVQAVTNVCISGDTLYLTGVRYMEDSNAIVAERVVAYDMRGASEQVVYDEQMDNNVTKTMQAMDEAEDGVYVVLCPSYAASATQSAIRVVLANRNGSRVVKRVATDINGVYDAGYNARIDQLRTISVQGLLGYSQSDDDATRIQGHRTFTTVDVADDGTTYVYDDSGCRVGRLGDKGDIATLLEGTGYSGIHINGSKLVVCNANKNEAYVCNLDGTNVKAIGSVEPSRALFVLQAVVWACRAYLVVYVSVSLLLKARSLVRRGQTHGFGAMFASVAVVAVVSLAIGYTSYESYQSTLTTRGKELNAFAGYLSGLSPVIGGHMKRCNARNAFLVPSNDEDEVLESLVMLELQVNNVAYETTQNGIGTYTVIYGCDDQGAFYVADSACDYIMGSRVSDSETQQQVQRIFKTGEADDELHMGRTRFDATQRRFVPIYDSEDTGKVVGVLEVGSRLRAFGASIAHELTQRVIALLVLVLVVYLTYSELRACVRCLLSYRELVHHHDAIAVLTRPFSFFVTLLSSIDAVMTALIARAILKSSGMAESGLLLALPAVMLGVGLALGQAVYALTGSRVVIRKLMVRGAVAMVAAALFTGLVVWANNFWLYCFAKLCMSVPFGLLYTLSYSLPRRARSDKVRVLAAGGIKRTDTSAAALGTVLGGYVAQHLGNAWVYVLVAGVGLVVCAMAARLLPNSKHPLEQESEAASRRQAMWRLLTSRTTLPIIFFLMLPAILSGGYNSFIFPLYSSNLGLETASINNLFVLGQLVVYVYISALERLEDRFDKWRVAMAAIALLGVVFLLFSTNTTLAWAVVTIALVGMLCKSSDGWKALWPRSAESMGLTTGLATGAMFAVRSVLLIVQPLLLGALLAWGNRTAVIVLGVICSVCAVAFYRTTRNTPLAPHDG